MVRSPLAGPNLESLQQPSDQVNGQCIQRSSMHMRYYPTDSLTHVTQILPDPTEASNTLICDSYGSIVVPKPLERERLVCQSFVIHRQSPPSWAHSLALFNIGFNNQTPRRVPWKPPERGPKSFPPSVAFVVPKSPESGPYRFRSLFAVHCQLARSWACSSAPFSLNIWSLQHRLYVWASCHIPIPVMWPARHGIPPYCRPDTLISHVTWLTFTQIKHKAISQIWKSQHWISQISSFHFIIKLYTSFSPNANPNITLCYEQSYIKTCTRSDLSMGLQSQTTRIMKQLKTTWQQRLLAQESNLGLQAQLLKTLSLASGLLNILEAICGVKHKKRVSLQAQWVTKLWQLKTKNTI